MPGNRQKNKKKHLRHLVRGTKNEALRYWVVRKVMKSFVWYNCFSFLRVYIGFLYTKKSLLKDEKIMIQGEK